MKMLERIELEKVKAKPPCLSETPTTLRTVPIELLRKLFEVRGDGALIRKTTYLHRKAGARAGFIDADGYRSVRVAVAKREYVTLRAHRVVFALTYGRWPEGILDHINGNRADNRPSNLREATLAQNQHNAGPPKTNTSGFVGVRWDARKGKWCASAWHHGKYLNFGRFDDPELAALVRDECVLRLRGEFARLNNAIKST